MSQEQLMQGARGVKHTVDVVAIAGVPWAVFDAQHLSWTYAFLSVVWIAFRIYEGRTFKQIVAAARRWLGI